MRDLKQYQPIHSTELNAPQRPLRTTRSRILAAIMVTLMALFAVFLLSMNGPLASLAHARPVRDALTSVWQTLVDPEAVAFVPQETATPAANSPLTSPTPMRIILPTLTPTPVRPIQPTAQPTSTPTAIPPTPTATVAATLAESLTLTGLTHEWQTWNNCGPATLSMTLSYHGIELGQAQVAVELRPNPEDKNVSPEEVVAYVQSQGLNALTRVNGDAATLKRLLNVGLPVIVEVWLEPEPNDGFGHYRLLTGYDDAAQRWIAYDSYVSENLVPTEGAYSGIYVPYDQLERQWRMFNRTFTVIYPQASQSQVDAAMAEFADDETMWQQALQRAQIEVEQNPQDAIAWFNQGSALVELAQYEAAAAAFDRAQAIGLPWRMLWYQFGPLEAYYETQRYDDMRSAAERALATTSNVEELYYWYGRALVVRGDIEGGRSAWSTALSLRPTYMDAQQALASLEQ